MKEVIIALRVFIVMTVLTGLVYPLLITGIAQAVFPNQANGSIIRQGDKVIGSSLIGQQFDDSRHFWSRPSATSSEPYNAASSSGSNLGPTNPELINKIKERVQALKVADPDNLNPVPTDLATASASGLDPNISVAAALYQVPRIARLRNISQAELKSLVQSNTHGPDLGLFGEPVVNVLELNLALDRINQHD